MPAAATVADLRRDRESMYSRLCLELSSTPECLPRGFGVKKENRAALSSAASAAGHHGAAATAIALQVPADLGEQAWTADVAAAVERGYGRDLVSHPAVARAA